MGQTGPLKYKCPLIKYIRLPGEESHPESHANARFQARNYCHVDGMLHVQETTVKVTYNRKIDIGNSDPRHPQNNAWKEPQTCEK